MTCINCEQTITMKAVGKPDGTPTPCSYYLPGGSDPAGVGPLCMRCYQIAAPKRLMYLDDHGEPHWIESATPKLLRIANLLVARHNEDNQLGSMTDPMNPTPEEVLAFRASQMRQDPLITATAIAFEVLQELDR